MKIFKGSKLYFIKFLLPVLFIILVFTITAYLTNDFFISANNIIISITFFMLLFSFFWNLLYSINVKLILTEDLMSLKSRLPIKYKISFDITSIQSVAYKISAFDALFRRVLVQIETENVITNKSRKVIIYLKQEYATELKNLLVTIY